MSLGPPLTPSQAFPAVMAPAAARARQVRQRRLLARVLPEVVADLTVRMANVSGRWSRIEARVARLAHRLDVRDGRA